MKINDNVSGRFPQAGDKGDEQFEWFVVENISIHAKTDEKRNLSFVNWKQ